MGGEKPSTYQVEYWALGSPPRGRGKDERRRPGEIRARITPAWAGKSWPLRDIHNLVWDHPRVGGEKFVRYGYKFPVGGSPPRGRGKVPETYRYVAGYGITPAWAGKSLGICACFPLVQDHPRVGGEKRDAAIPRRDLQGSPPRGRGKAFSGMFGRSWTGITPAWAGKSLTPPSVAVSGQDHPRVGGEKCGVGQFKQIMKGSPPRGRGKGRQSRRNPPPNRITPAWAGKSDGITRRGSFFWDHPRVGGEKLI